MTRPRNSANDAPQLPRTHAEIVEDAANSLRAFAEMCCVSPREHAEVYALAAAVEKMMPADSIPRHEAASNAGRSAA